MRVHVDDGHAPTTDGDPFRGRLCVGADGTERTECEDRTAGSP